MRLFAVLPETVEMSDIADGIIAQLLSAISIVIPFVIVAWGICIGLDKLKVWLGVGRERQTEYDHDF